MAEQTSLHARAGASARPSAVVRGLRRLLAPLLVAVVALTSVGVASPARASDAQVAEQIVQLLNDERARLGLSPLQRVQELDAVAQGWSKKQAASDTLGHNPVYSQQYPAGWQYAAENVAYAGSSATGKTFFDMWMDSSPHKRNLLNPALTHIGVGVATTADGRKTYATQNFAQYPSRITLTPTLTAPTTDVARLSGGDRYEVSAAVSRASFVAGVPVVYVANGLASADALAAAPVAGMTRGPVLLTQATGLPASVTTELARLKPAKIVILGSAASVSTEVQAQLGGYAPSVQRWSGSDRYEVSATVSAATFAPGVAVAYVANGLASADALSAAPVAGRTRGPVLLTQATALPGAVRAELARLKPAKVVVLGGTSSVSSQVQAELAGYAGSVQRWSGTDRYEVSATASRATFAPGVPVAYVANGLAYADALAAAPVAVLNGAPVLLTQAGGLPTAVRTELERLDPDRIVVLGSTASVSTTVVDQLARIG